MARKMIFAFRIVVSALVASAASIGVCSAAGTATETKQELERVRTETQQTRRELETARKQQSVSQQQLRHVESAVAAASLELRNTRQRIAAAFDNLARLQNNFQRQHQLVGKTRGELAAQLLASYRQSQAGHIKSFMSPNGIATAEREIRYRGLLARLYAERLAATEDSAVELKRTQGDIALQQEALEQFRQEQSIQLATLEAQAGERQRLVAQFAAEISEKQTELNDLAENERQLADTLRQLMRKLARSPAGGFVGLRGSLPRPVEGPILRGFGGTGQASAKASQGVIIGAAVGQEVRAVAAGKVVFADWLRGYGWLLIIDHGGGYLSLYGQNESLLKREGESVAQGDVIASAGLSGGQSRSGVYFEIRHKGQPVDPLAWWKAK